MLRIVTDEQQRQQAFRPRPSDRREKQTDSVIPPRICFSMSFVVISCQFISLADQVPTDL